MLLKLAHSSPWAAHLGRRETLERLQQHFYWPGMTQDVKRLTRECVDCQKGNKDKTGKAPLVNLPVITSPIQRIAMDVVGPLPLTARKNRYILTLSTNEGNVILSEEECTGVPYL